MNIRKLFCLNDELFIKMNFLKFFIGKQKNYGWRKLDIFPWKKWWRRKQFQRSLRWCSFLLLLLSLTFQRILFEFMLILCEMNITNSKKICKIYNWKASGENKIVSMKTELRLLVFQFNVFNVAEITKQQKKLSQHFRNGI